MQTAPHFIISRTDNIGDIVLALPMATLLKQRLPTCKISFLARDYVADVVAAYADIDAFISWDALQRLPFSQAAMELRRLRADTILHVFPNKQIAKLAKTARIANRIGSSRRIYHWFTCNKRVNFSRKHSSLHEAQLNLQLLQPSGINTLISLPELQQLLRLPKSANINDKVKSLLTEDGCNIVVHPLTNGNTPEWPLEKFTCLIQQLSVKEFSVIITGTEQERPRLQTLFSACPQIKDAVGQLTLTELMQLLSHVHGIVANATGPLHLGAALGVNTLGIYPTAKGSDISRWGAIGERVKTLSAADVNQITPEQVGAIIDSW